MSFSGPSTSPLPDVSPIHPNTDRAALMVRVPIRITLCPHDTDDDQENLIKYRRDRKEKHLKALAKKYLIVEQTSPDSVAYFARWNPDAVPGPREVKRMLDWYATKKIFDFPRVKSVKLLGTGFTNVYFLVRFYIAATDEQAAAAAALPEKVILRLSAPLYVTEDPQNDFDSRLDHEIAAMCWVRRTGKVPRVFVYDPTAQNELRLEWLVMEPVEGFVLRKCVDQGQCTCESGLHGLQPVGRPYPFYGPEEKERTEIELHELYDSFLGSGSRSVGDPELGKFIGGLELRGTPSRELRVTKGRFMDKRFDVAKMKSKLATNRGPFPTFEHYFDELFEVAYHGWESGMRYELKVELERQLGKQGLNYREFLANIREEEAHYLCVHNLNLDQGNILVDEDGKIKAVMGWEDALVFPREWLGHLTDLVIAIARTGDLRFRPLNEMLWPFRYLGRWGLSPIVPHPKVGLDNHPYKPHQRPDSHLYSSTHFDINEPRIPEPKKGFLSRVATQLKDL